MSSLRLFLYGKVITRGWPCVIIVLKFPVKVLPRVNLYSQRTSRWSLLNVSRHPCQIVCVLLRTRLPRYRQRLDEKQQSRCQEESKLHYLCSMRVERVLSQRVRSTLHRRSTKIGHIPTTSTLRSARKIFNSPPTISFLGFSWFFSLSCFSVVRRSLLTLDSFHSFTETTSHFCHPNL